jgi:hypothetical protein
MSKQRMIREEPDAAGDAEVLRAHLLNSQLLRENAETNFALYGFYGLSVFYPVGDWPKDRILAEKLQDAAKVTVLRRNDLAARDLRVLPTGAEPHGDIVGALTTGHPGGDAGDPNALIAAIRAVRHHVEDNPHYRRGDETS